jgi:Na+/melibiose symporter-like transporter
MKIFNTVILSIAIGFLIIGIHQSLTFGFEASYWLFMITLALLLWFKIRRNRENDPPVPNNKRNNKKSRSIKGRR